MDRQHWQTVKNLLEKALDLEQGERRSYLADACGANRELFDEVESLLNYDGVPVDALEQPAFAGVLTEASHSMIGQQIGKYKVIDELGGGGMGSVFLAKRVDGDFDQQVALKVIKRGMDSDAIRRRFLNERRILASLQHPNIAHLIDGGTTDDGLPYFVMEFVSGEAITQYARTNELGLTERLDLFREVCSAVSYAHQNLVIHRDIKPSNILITADGTPKLLDFGIAKILRPDGHETATQHFAFTPDYASPEQIRGETLGTASDVYSLGIVLYELLTGTRPFGLETKNLGQIIETVTQTEAKKPSTTRDAHKGLDQTVPADYSYSSTIPFPPSRLRGDLDNIVLKALKKDISRRYASVEQFSNDIRRYLRGLPVSARQDTWRYRSESFMRRNPYLVGAVAAAFLFLVFGITATSLFAARAEAERQKAERRFNDVRSLANSLIFEVNEKIDESPIRAREMLVKRSVEYLDKLAVESDNDITLQAELAAAYEKIGDVQAKHFGSGIGDSAGAIQNHQKALTIREKLHSLAPDNVKFALDVATSFSTIADHSVTTGDTKTALNNYNRAVATIESIHDRNPDDHNIKRELARSYAKLGQGILRSGSISKSLEAYERAAALMNEVAVTDPANLGFQHAVGVYQSYVGYAKSEMGRADEALEHFFEALQINTRIWLYDTANIENQRNLSTAELWTGFALRRMGRFSEAYDRNEKALEIQQKIYEMDRSNVGDVNSLADCNIQLGMTLYESGKPRDASKYLERGISLYTEAARTDPNNLSVQRQIAFSRRHLADAIGKAGNVTAAIKIYRTALGETTKIIEKDEKNSEFSHDQAICLLRLAEHGAADQADLGHAVKILEKLVSESPERIQWRADLEKARQILQSKKLDR